MVIWESTRRLEEVEWSKQRKRVHWAGGFDCKRKNVTALCPLGITLGFDWPKAISHFLPEVPESCLRVAPASVTLDDGS